MSTPDRSNRFVTDREIADHLRCVHSPAGNIADVDISLQAGWRVGMLLCVTGLNAFFSRTQFGGKSIQMSVSEGAQLKKYLPPGLAGLYK